MLTSLPSGLCHHGPGRLIGNRENPIIGSLAVLIRIGAQTIRHFWGNEYDFVLIAAFGLLKDQLAILNVNQPQFQDLTDTHSAPRHQLQYQPVAALGGPKNDFVNGLFFKHIQFEGDPLPVQFSNQRHVTGIWTIRIEVFFDEVEKRG